MVVPCQGTRARHREGRQLEAGIDAGPEGFLVRVGGREAPPAYAFVVAGGGGAEEAGEGGGAREACGVGDGGDGGKVAGVVGAVGVSGGRL